MTEIEPGTPVPTEPTQSAPASSGRRRMTGRERRRRIWLLVILLALLALLAYATYYFTQNRRLPMLGVAPPEAAMQPPQYLYSITGRGESELERPVGVAVGEDGRVYVADFGNRRISAFTNAGRFLFAFNKVDKEALQAPVHLVVKDGEVWVTDRFHDSIYVFDLQGKYLREFLPKNEETVKWGPLALGFDGDRLRVTDVGQTSKHQLLYFSEEGSRTASIGHTAQTTSVEQDPGAFLFPDGLAVSDAGEVFVSDGNNRRVQVFDRNAAFARIIDTSGVPRGVAIDSESRLYVVDAIAHTVDIYDLKGKRLTQFGSQGFGPGQFNYPNDITIDERDRIYVTDRENNQVQVWGWPTAEPPAVAAPTTPLGWVLCLSPLLLLPLLFLLRKVRIIVTPDFVDALEAAGLIEAVSRMRRLRLVALEQDHKYFEGRVVNGVDLARLIEPDVYSESDARALRERLEISEREAALLSVADRVKGLATTDRELRRLAVLAEVRVLDLEEFQRDFLRK